VGAPIGCFLQLASADAPGRLLESKEVAGRFNENFMVPPTSATYVIKVTCNGGVAAERIVARPTAGPVDFGEIAL